VRPIRPAAFIVPHRSHRLSGVLLDIDAVRASAARVEWRPSLTMLHQGVDEFAG
jgi:hypothetical protein